MIRENSIKEQNESSSVETMTESKWSDDKILLSVDKLIVGEELFYPVFDECGLLLLAEGTVLTARFQRRLKEHGIYEVLISKKYLDHENSETQPVVENEESSEKEDRSLAEKVDELIDAGTLHVQNRGPTFQQEIVDHQLNLYNTEIRDAILEHYQESVAALDAMMKSAMDGKSLNASRLLELANGFLKYFIRDIDSLLSMTSESTLQDSLAQHCTRQAILGMAIGIEMGMNESNVRNIGLCGLLHDWGMMRVPQRIREANRALSYSEFFEIKKHPAYTLGLLQQIEGLPDFVPVVCYQVHERPNGTGYPLGRSEETIHLFAKILSVADSYLGMISPRPHRPPVMPYAAMECLIRLTSQQTLDADVVRAMLEVQSLFPVGSYVTLSDESLARVYRHGTQSYMTPVVQVVEDYRGCRLDLTDEKSIIDLSKSEIKIKQSTSTPGREEIGLSPAVIDQPRR